MTTNRLARQSGDDIVCPPKGDSAEEKSVRIRFWVARGNDQLSKEGRDHLEWRCVNGHYFIDHRGG